MCWIRIENRALIIYVCILTHDAINLKTSENRVPQESFWPRIHACTRFIHENHLGSTDHRHREAEFSSSSTGTFLSLLVGMFMDL